MARAAAARVGNTHGAIAETTFSALAARYSWQSATQRVMEADGFPNPYDPPPNTPSFFTTAGLLIVLIFILLARVSPHGRGVYRWSDVAIGSRLDAQHLPDRQDVA